MKRAGGGVECDLSRHARALSRDLCERIPELAHIDPASVLFCLSRSRAGGVHGTYARIAPLRFAGGRSETTRRRGNYRETYRLPFLEHEGRPILYLVYLLAPRFLRLSPTQKLHTIIHELYHISESCDGDLRRFPGRNFAHGASREQYNRRIARLADVYLESGPAPGVLDFLRHGEEAWKRGDLTLTGLRVPLPKARLVARQRL